MSSYQGGSAGGGYREAPPPAGGGWNGWDEPKEDQGAQKAADRGAKGKAAGTKWAGWDAGDELPDEVWDADWGK